MSHGFARDGQVCFVAFDPGGTTGWATYHAEMITNPETREREWLNARFDSGQLEGADHHLALWNLLGSLHTTDYVVITESFQYWKDQRENVVQIPLEYIGVMKLFVQDRNKTLPPDMHIRYVEQTPVTGKGFWYPKKKGTQQRDSSKLKAVGLYTPLTYGAHQNDATAHLLHWMSFGPLKRKDLFLPLKDM